MTGSKVSSSTFTIGGREVAKGKQIRFDLPAALLPTKTPLHIPVTVMNGLRPGPRLWVSAAIHGDELNGVEIVGQLLRAITEPLQRGVLIAVPIVNVFGFIGQSRYFPDRRDLNRSFPGSPRGSLAGRIAHIFMTEIVSRCTHGIDLHTGSLDRSNLPQTRGDLKDAETRRFAEAFGAPVMVQSVLRDGSLRAAATKRGIPVLVFEGGEPQRYNPEAIDVGVRGVLQVMKNLKMIPTTHRRRAKNPSILIDGSRWVRARRGGLVRLLVEEGDKVAEKQAVATISDPFGGDRISITAPFAGIVIGIAKNPVTHGGDAVVHVGKVSE